MLRQSANDCVFRFPSAIRRFIIEKSLFPAAVNQLSILSKNPFAAEKNFLFTNLSSLSSRSLTFVSRQVSSCETFTFCFGCRLESFPFARNAEISALPCALRKHTRVPLERKANLFGEHETVKSLSVHHLRSYAAAALSCVAKTENMRHGEKVGNSCV